MKLAFANVSVGGLRRNSRRVQLCSVGGGVGGSVGEGNGRGGEDGGGGSGGSGGSGDGSVVSVMAMYGKTAESLAPEARGLGAEELKGYLEATKSGLVGYLADVWPAWRRKMAADPKFAFKLLMEETVGLGLAVSGMVAARGKEILNELDFAFCDMMVGAVLNFTALWIASPSVRLNSNGSSAVANYIKSLPSNLFVVRL